MNEPTVERLNELFYYKDGNLVWKDVNTKMKGKKAGCVKAKGYVYVGVDNKQFRVHRLIYLMHHGHVPEIVDHIDENRLNNRIENLQEVSNSENLRKANRSGIVGLTRHHGIWRLVVEEDGKTVSLGNFSNKQSAIFEAIAYYGSKFKEVASSEIFEIFGKFCHEHC